MSESGDETGVYDVSTVKVYRSVNVLSSVWESETLMM